jgi:hypothetical protein
LHFTKSSLLTVCLITGKITFSHNAQTLHVRTVFFLQELSFIL